MGKWDVFLEKTPNAQICALCKATLKKGKDSSTTGYLYHFRTKHQKEYEKISGTMRKSKTAPEYAVKKKKVQLTLQESFDYWELEGSRTRDIERRIMQMICIDEMPLQTPNKEGFSSLMEMVAPRFKLKDWSYYMRNILPSLYTEYVGKLKCELESVPAVSISLDMWSDRSLKHELLGATVHFLDKNGFPAHRVIGCVDASEQKHTGLNISEMTKKLLSEFGLDGKVTAILRDGASNMGLAGRLLDLPSWDCWSQKLNLVTKSATTQFSELDSLIEKTKRLIRKIRKSSVAKMELDSLQDSLQIPQTCLIKSVDVRWNNLHTMFARFLDLKTPLSLLLATNPTWGSFDENDWSLMAATAELLNPIFRASQLSQSRCATSSSIIPTIKIMLRELAKPSTFTAPRTKMIEKLKDALMDYQNCDHLRIGMSIDPRFRFAFGDTEDKQKLIELLSDKIETFPDAVEKQETAHEGVASLFDEYLMENGNLLNDKKQDSRLNEEVAIIAEVEKWSKGSAQPSVDPFEFWSSPLNRAKFPIISRIVPFYFCSPPGSSETERGVVEFLFTERRKCIYKEHFKPLLFLAANLPLMGLER